jgi:DNA polymerase-3 subunit epsilon
VRKDLRSFKLSSLAAYFSSPTTPNHRALDDTLATAHVFWALLERAGSIGVTHLDDLLALPTIKGCRAIGKLALTENLPRSPGVYTFRDKIGTAIYIGKATNLRSRVRSYFGGDTRRRIDDILRDLHTIEHRVTLNEFEASVVEVRAISADNPRYNRRSRQPRSLHWVRLTAEKYPRLSVVRTHGQGLMHLGPFRNRHQAETAMHGLWDATRIRRCTAEGRGCGFAELGVSVCPHSGEVSHAAYLEIVQHLISGIDTDPRPLFARLTARMVTLVEHQRFEDAALVKDRWNVLSRAIEQRRIWASLQKSGVIHATDANGVAVAIHRGRMEAVWIAHNGMPFTTEPPDNEDYPPSAVALEEAMLAWKWLMSSGVTISHVSGVLACPPHALPELISLD